MAETKTAENYRDGVGMERCLFCYQAIRTLDDAPVIYVREAAFLALMASMDAWLGNEDGLMIEDVVDWRNQLAAALGKKKY